MTPRRRATEAEPAERVAELVRSLDRHLRLYHLEDAPEISDAEYDELFRELQDLEAAHPELARADSPTQRVGAPPAEGFATAPHRRPMLSLDNAMDADALRAFDERIRSMLGRETTPVAYVIEGPGTIPAEFQLRDTSTAVFVDDRDNAFPRTALRAMVGVEITDRLIANEVLPARMLVDSRDVMPFVWGMGAHGVVDRAARKPRKRRHVFAHCRRTFGIFTNSLKRP